MWLNKMFYLTGIVMLICLSACEQNAKEERPQAKIYDGHKKQIDKWTMIQNDASESFVPFLLASRGITNANAKQGLLFVRKKDENGQLLKAGKSYTIKGDSIQAESWSLSVYHGNKLIATRKQHYVSSYEVSDNTKWQIMLSPNKMDNSPWLVNAKNEYGSPKIALRVYNPSPSFLKNLGKNQLPSVQSVEQ